MQCLLPVSVTVFSYCKIRFVLTIYISILAVPASAQEILESTSLLNIRVGSSRSEIANNLSIGGFELADGTPITFSDWYRPKFPDLNFTLITELSPSFGITWGFSLGERGEKYKINLGFWVGAIYRAEISPKSSISVAASTLLGGNLQEFSCSGDYGDIAGVQEVNCRLADSLLPPADTIQFLVSEPGFIETQFSIRYEFRF